MASWPARFISNSLGSNSGLPTPTSPAPTPSSMRRQTHTVQGDPTVQPLYDIPVLQPSPKQATRHGRSLSHPFPSIFKAGKKVGRKGHAHDTFELDSTDDENATAPTGAFTSASANFDQDKARQGGPEKDLVTGKCMTCDSLARWSKERNVFRCTICLTINDLKPHAAVGPVDARLQVKGTLFSGRL
jgi:E3 ubiquitin-protein ligase HECTD2